MKEACLYQACAMLRRLLRPLLTNRMQGYCMGRALVLLLITTFCLQIVGGQTNEDGKGELLDVIVVDLSCTANNSSDCEGFRPQHFIEYMGADWCEPCLAVEAQLENDPPEGAFIMKHHPSVKDSSYLSASEFRFTNILGLWGLPSVIIDGEGLLSGTSQIAELNSATSNRTSTSFYGITSIQLNETTLTWETNTSGTFAEIWTLKTVKHSNEGYNLTNLAVNQTHNNNGTVKVDTTGEFLVIMLHIDGPVDLEIQSDAFAHGGFDPIDEDDISYSEGDSEVRIPAFVFLVMLLLIMPAIYQHINQMKLTKESEEE